MSHETCIIQDDMDTGGLYCVNHREKICRICQVKIPDYEITCKLHGYEQKELFLPDDLYE